MFIRVMGERFLAAESGPRLLQCQIVHDPAVVVQRLVDAVELVAGHDVSAHLALDIGKPLVVGVAEGFEGLHEFVEGGRHRVGHGLHLRRDRRCGRFGGLVSHVAILVSEVVCRKFLSEVSV